MSSNNDMPNLIDLLEQGSEFIGNNSNLTEENKQLFFWATMCALYFANRIAKQGDFPTINALDTQICSVNLKPLENPISDEKKKKMLDFYQAVLANRAQLLAVQKEMLPGNIPGFGFPQGERNLLKSGISDMLSDGNLKQKEFTFDKNTPHGQLIQKFESRLAVLEVIDSIFKFLGLPGFAQEIKEVEGYTDALKKGVKKGLPVSSVTETWKSQNPNQQLFTNFSWLYSSNRTHTEIIESEVKFLSPFRPAAAVR